MLEPCVPQRMRGRGPELLRSSSVPGVQSIAVVHGTHLQDRKQKLVKLLELHGLRNVSFINAYDGETITQEDQSCFFGNSSGRIGGSHCCNRLSSVLKPHLAFFAMVKMNVPSMLVLEDDLRVLPAKGAVRGRLTEAARQLGTCDLVQVARFAVGYIISNAGARMFLHFSLRINGTRIRNPHDWVMEEMSRKKPNGFRLCQFQPRVFEDTGHGSNHGGSHSSLILKPNVQAGLVNKTPTR